VVDSILQPRFFGQFEQTFNMTDVNVPPPLFASANPSRPKTSTKSTAALMNLDDIFGDVMFTPDGDTVFLSEEPQEPDIEGLLNSGEGSRVSTMASKPTSDGRFVPVQQGGGLYTTQLAEQGKPSLTMGSAAAHVPQTAHVPFKQAPQAEHHLQYAAPKKKKGSKDRKMSEQQKTDRRYVLYKHSCPSSLWSGALSFICLYIQFHLTCFEIALQLLIYMVHLHSRDGYQILVSKMFLHITGSVIANMPSAVAFAKSSC
jgi:hypothetical protein